MNGAFIPQMVNSHALNYVAIDKANIPLYGTEGAITRLDNAYFKSQVGGLVILSLAFTTTVDLPADTAIMGFNSYTGTPNSNVYGVLVHANGTSTSVYLSGSNVCCSSIMATGNWRGFIMFTIEA